MNDNKMVDAALDTIMARDFAAGHWPQVQYKHDEHCTSFSLYEYGDARNAYRTCFHWMLRERGYGLGIYEKGRSKAWLTLVEGLAAKMHPVHSDDLAVGQRLIMKNPFGQGPRWATVAEPVYLDAIFDVTVEEKNGCTEETGSAYVWEIVAIEIDGIWQPFEISEAERAFKKEVDAC